MLRIILFLIAVLHIAGCKQSTEPKPDWICVVHSSTSWNGYFADHTVAGNGNAEVDLPDDEIVCVSVQKQTGAGSLSIAIVERGQSPSQWVSTAAEYGIVEACNE